MKNFSLLLMFFVLAGAVFYSAAGGVTAGSNEEKSIQRAVFKVENLSCGACFTNINAKLSPLEGFSGMGSNLFRKLIAIDFIAPLSPDKIRDSISKIGYPATLESVDTILEKESFAYLNTRSRGLGYGKGGCCSGGSPRVSQSRSELPEGGSCCPLPGSSQALINQSPADQSPLSQSSTNQTSTNSDL